MGHCEPQQLSMIADPRSSRRRHDWGGDASAPQTMANETPGSGTHRGKLARIATACGMRWGPQDIGLARALQ